MCVCVCVPVLMFSAALASYGIRDGCCIIAVRGNSNNSGAAAPNQQPQVTQPTDQPTTFVIARDHTPSDRLPDESGVCRQGARGFDRLREAGFSVEDVNQFRGIKYSEWWHG